VPENGRMGRSEMPARMRADHRVPYEERFWRYSHNSGVTAAYAERDAGRQEKAAGMHGSASDNAYDHDDRLAADWYEDMERYSLEAAAALRKLAAAARKLEAHYETRAKAAAQAAAEESA
jgi:hypothetical protein